MGLGSCRIWIDAPGDCGRHVCGELTNTATQKEGVEKVFIIKCSECGTLAELDDGFLKKAGDIAVYNSGENIVSLQCNECENEIFSSED